MERDVAVVLSGGAVNGLLMELGFLKRLRETDLWPRIGWIYGTSAGALAGTMAALEYDGPRYDIFNLGESETIQLKELILAIENALGKKAKVNRLPEQPGDMPLTCADISKARKLLGYNPTTKFSKGLPRFVDWFLSSQRL